MTSLLAVEVPYWGQSLLRVLGGIVAVLLPAGTIVYLFLFKMMSFMQSRLGPMEAGPYGSMQLLAEVGKWLQKEDIIPENADRTIFKIAPLIVLASTFLLVVVVPFGPDALMTDFQAGITTILEAMSMGRPVICSAAVGQTSWCTVRLFSATVVAKRVSSYCAASRKAPVKVWKSPSYAAAARLTTVELSMPPDRWAPTGTSDRSWILTAS